LKNKFSGKFIVLDGPDGCGKTVQLELLSTYLKGKGIPVVQTNDPGGTKIGTIGVWCTEYMWLFVVLGAIIGAITLAVTIFKN